MIWASLDLFPIVLVTLGGWRLLGGRSLSERNRPLWLPPDKFVRVWRPPQGLPLVVEKRLYGVVSKGELGEPSWRWCAFVVTSTSLTVTSFPPRKWTPGYIFVSVTLVILNPNSLLVVYLCYLSIHTLHIACAHYIVLAISCTRLIIQAYPLYPHVHTCIPWYIVLI